MNSKYKFFWKGILSNFAHTPYTSRDGIEFCCVEQEFMYRKALYFEDTETAGKIMKSQNPQTIKKLGREVRGYVDSLWDSVREEFMYQACLSKFSQHRGARRELLSYPGKIFVEASPYDIIWGIGLSEDDPRAEDESQWRGKNLLGQILTTIRNEII